MKVVPYEATHEDAWNETVHAARNGHFLFDRRYMDYHANRIRDASILVLDGDSIVALFVASRDGDAVVGHGGLTFGGMVCARTASHRQGLGAWNAVVDHLRGAGVHRLVVKPVPHIYHVQPCDEPLLALHTHGARLVRRDVSSALAAGDRLPKRKGRRAAIKQARKVGVTVTRSDRLEDFMAMATAQLRERHDATLTHTPAEIRLLADRFPENIHLHTAERDGELLAGVVVYETPTVVHTQYIAADDAGRDLHATDLVLDHLLELHQDKWFDFGISNEGSGGRVNQGLLRYKESFGARSICYDRYELDLSSASNADRSRT